MSTMIRGMGIRNLSAGSFTPASISGLVAWYDASNTASITKAGTAVSAWNDISGNNNHLTTLVGAATYEATGFNSTHPDIFLNNAATFTTNADSVTFGSTTSSVFMVCGLEVINSADFGAFCSFIANGQVNDSTAGGSRFLYVRTSGLLGSQRNGTNYSSDSLLSGTTTANYRLGNIYTGNSTNYQNGSAGSPVAFSGSNYASPGTIQIGHGAQIHVAEVVYYNNAISAPNIASLDAYFKTRWGL